MLPSSLTGIPRASRSVTTSPTRRRAATTPTPSTSPRYAPTPGGRTAGARSAGTTSGSTPERRSRPGSAWFKEPCSFCPAKPARPVAVTGRHLQGKILMINETFDAATPYSGALEVRRRFPTASLIEGVGGTTHSGTPNGVACTDTAIGRYLSDGTVPVRQKGDRSDLQCRPTPQPDPSKAGTAGRVNTQVRDLLRRELGRAWTR
ncbi:MAG: alpha/beta hydrolase [Nocardioides sp.]|nr:alpha/beta hydrolase [Nocardioides sp.]